MSKKKNSYADVWIKAYLASLTRVSPKEAVNDANEAIAHIRNYLTCGGTHRVFVKKLNQSEVDIRAEYWSVPVNENGFPMGQPHEVYIKHLNEQSKNQNLGQEAV